MWVGFSADKNGRRIAYRQGWGRRWFRMPLTEAEILVASGQARDASEALKAHLEILRARRDSAHPAEATR